ncbi:MAG: 23S rRNA (adenine(2503)-C(2))-methyltransferase RlmN [Candidatus Omnitrophica bacterium]|nr:23S rRNA (adenine(2503)-C(2))-methyltransferase RlmN [Candidatus Omnitrophota bacterium]
MKVDIRDFTLEELTSRIISMGEPAHRARQIFSWIYAKGADSFDEMTDIPGSLAERMDSEYTIGCLKCAERLKSGDGTEKFLWRLDDGYNIESVLIKEKKRRTLCLSTQVGCRYACRFCASGKMGFKRDLRVGEITGQLLSVQKKSAQRITNAVFMGMGEPLDNYPNLESSIKIMNDPLGIGLGARKITVSTCGIVPGIRRLMDIGLQVELSVSLHAPTDGLRDELVPVNRRYPLEELIRTCAEYTQRTKRVITLEYTLISQMNDSLECADKLAGIAKRLAAKVNLIACNPSADTGATPPEAKRVRTFTDCLRSRGVNVTLRRSRGSDIMAACGQLAARKREQRR